MMMEGGGGNSFALVHFNSVYIPMTFFRLFSTKNYHISAAFGAYLLRTAAAAITAIAIAAALVVILFVFLELILAGCRTEISSCTFNF